VSVLDIRLQTSNWFSIFYSRLITATRSVVIKWRFMTLCSPSKKSLNHGGDSAQVCERTCYVMNEQLDLWLIAVHIVWCTSWCSSPVQQSWPSPPKKSK